MKLFYLLLGGWVMLTLPSSCVSNVEEDLYPVVTCDTSVVSYASTIVPILTNNCYVCHGATGSISGIPLEGYDHLKTMVDAGRLLGAVKHEPGFSPMPQNAPALSECNVLKIELWVESGAPNN